MTLTVRKEYSLKDVTDAIHFGKYSKQQQAEIIERYQFGYQLARLVQLGFIREDSLTAEGVRAVESIALYVGVIS